MADWCVWLRRTKLAVEAEDRTTTISHSALAAKMLRGSGPGQKGKSQLLYNSGGKYDSERIESCLRNMYGRQHLHEKRLASTSASRSTRSHRPFHRNLQRDPQERYKPFVKKKVYIQHGDYEEEEVNDESDEASKGGD